MADGLSPFEGRDVVQTTVKITKAGDGLSEALGIDPAEYHLGDRVVIVLDTVVDRVRYLPVKDTEVLTREHSFKTDGATVIDRDLVAAALDAQADRIAVAKEAGKGVQRLDFTDDQTGDAGDDGLDDPEDSE